MVCPIVVLLLIGMAAYNFKPEDVQGDSRMADDTATGVPDPLKKNLDWYIANQRELSANYNGKVLLIVDQRLVQAFADFGEAYTEALKSFAPGTFTLQYRLRRNPQTL